ncbi:MAG: A/G-specific adenine glycosylase [Chloroflexi bacterium]|nr:A/G-specific adenine glycosylase [Chloroflexota bacterium]
MLRLLAWYQGAQRDLPWRHTRDPYAILVAEVMLQQTQVSRVVPRYDQFLACFPTWHALADAPVADVIRAWEPLGYNRRAVRLHRLAQAAVHRWDGDLPHEPELLRCLEGIGPYTAAAVACFAFGAPVPVLDTNARRVLLRLFLGPAKAQERELRALAQEAVAALPEGQAPAWNQALMDLGATVCTSRKPLCPRCPLRADCRSALWMQRANERVAEARGPYRALRLKPFRGSSRYYRGRIVHQLRLLPPGESVALEELGTRVKTTFAVTELPWLYRLVATLEREGLARVEAASGLTLNSELGHVRVRLP